MSAEFSLFSQSLSDWLSYLEGIHYRSVDLGLERMEVLAAALDLKRLPAGKIITVTGTNGKGSVTNLLGKFLRRQGYSVCIYNSPHLIRFNERITLGNRFATDEELLNAFRIIEEKRRELKVSLTFFEFTTLAAFYLFRSHPSDFVILEVGMGGRYDSVNILDADLAVITNVALDHTSFLGENREEIGYQKAGIIKEHSHLVYGEENMPSSVRNYAAEMHALVTQCYSELRYRITGNREWTFICSNGEEINHLPEPDIPVGNAAIVLCALEDLGINLQGNEISAVLSAFHMPGRFQIVREHPAVVVDVGHNPHAFAYLKLRLNELKSLHNGCRVSGVLGMLHDKDFSLALKIIAEELDVINLCSLPGPRGTRAEDLASELQGASCDVNCFSDPVSAYEDALKNSSTGDIILVAGSFLTTGAVLQHLYPDYQDFLKGYS